MLVGIVWHMGFLYMLNDDNCQSLITKPRVASSIGLHCILHLHKHMIQLQIYFHPSWWGIIGLFKASWFFMDAQAFSSLVSPLVLLDGIPITIKKKYATLHDISINSQMHFIHKFMIHVIYTTYTNQIKHASIHHIMFCIS